MSWGPDWPTVALQQILQDYDLRILGRERQRTGPSHWLRELQGRAVYDPDGTWTDTHYTIRRDITCEACGHRFGYNFEVDQVSRVHKAGRSTDGTLRRELGRQLRRRIRCPHCRAVQREPRRTLRREDQKLSALSCGLIFGGILAVLVLGGLGGWLAGMAGILVGLTLGVVAGILLWFFAFPYILSIGPFI